MCPNVTYYTLDWEALIPAMVFTYNTTLHRTTLIATFCSNIWNRPYNYTLILFQSTVMWVKLVMDLVSFEIECCLLFENVVE
jgi:hypothetical protein